MSSDFSQHAQTMIEILTRTSPQDTYQMKRVFELSALLMQPDAQDFWVQFEQFPFQDIESRVLVSLLSTPLDAAIVNKSPINWSEAVNLPAPRIGNLTDERAFIVNHKHNVSLAPLFFLSSYLQSCIPEPQDLKNRERHSQHCRNFQMQCLDDLEKKGVTGETQMYWEPFAKQSLTLREIALGLNSPHILRWLENFEWKDEKSLETTMLMLLSSTVHLDREKMVAGFSGLGEKKPSLSLWFDVFNKIMSKVQKSGFDEVNLLQEVSLSCSNDTQLTIAQIIFQVLEKERGYCHAERIALAKKSPSHKVKQEDLGPEIKNSGKQVLKNIFKKSLRRLSCEQQEQVVKDVLHTITNNPYPGNAHLWCQCEFLMEAAPVSLRNTIKQQMLNTTSMVGSKENPQPRNGFYLFNSSPIYKGILTVEETRTILEKEVAASISQDKKISPLVLLMHMCPPQLHEGIKTIIQHIQSSPKSHSELRLELAAMIERIELPTQEAPKRKM